MLQCIQDNKNERLKWHLLKTIFVLYAYTQVICSIN